MFKKYFTDLFRKFRESVGEPSRIQAELAALHREIERTTPSNPAARGYKIYSQCDEDGIIAEIFERIGEGTRSFVEIGSSDGLENNTHALLLKGWSGTWVDADAGKIARLKQALPATDRLRLQQLFVTSKNAAGLVHEAMSILSTDKLDLLSVDIDGDDLGVVASVLATTRPRVVCVEYNAKFPPPMKTAADPRKTGNWRGDDYQGASLAALSHELELHGYCLVCCNASGVNAFFVQAAESANFQKFTVAQLYQPARYHLRRLTSGHPPSLTFLVDELSGVPVRPPAA